MNTQAAPQKTTSASTAFQRLRADIQSGTLQPGRKIVIREVCDRLDVGLSPVREALNRLVAEGLVEQWDNRGFAVAPISLDVLKELTQARCWLDEIGLRQSIELGDQAWEEALLVSCHRLARTPRTLGDVANPEWENTHRAFHANLVAACGSNWLKDTCNRLLESAERYRSLARQAGMTRHDPADEHKEITEAAIWRDADRAVELLHQHYERTAQMVRKVIEDGGSG